MTTVVHVPGSPHRCDLPRGTDKPGTVRRCDCGRRWVAEKPPEVRGGQQIVGVRWRPEKRSERRRKERAGRKAIAEYPPSAERLEAPPVTRGGYSGLRPASEVPPPEPVPSGAVLPSAELASLRAENAQLRRLLNDPDFRLREALKYERRNPQPPLRRQV
jgi:hypothetical protein